MFNAKRKRVATRSTEGKVASCRTSVTKRVTRMITRARVMLKTRSRSKTNGRIGIIITAIIMIKAMAMIIFVFL